MYTFAQDGSVQPELAADFPVVSADGLTMTVTLRPGLKYSDGSPVDPADAVTAFTRTKAGANASRLAAFESAEVKDGAIVFHMSAPVSITSQGSLFVDWMTLHPSSKVEDATYWEKPVSAAQYVVSEWTPGGPTMTLTPNPNYWRGKPAIAKLILSSAADATSRVLQVTTGAVDIAVDIPGNITNQLPAEVKTAITPIGGVYWLGFRVDATVALSDVRVRQALCLAIDREAVVARAFQGNSEPSASVVSKYTPGWQDTAILPGGGARDVEAAKELLASAGYPEGFTFNLQTWGNRPGWADAAQVIAESLGDINVKATIENVQDTVGIANLTNSTFDVMFSGGAGDIFALLGTLYDPTAFWGKATHFDDPDVTAMLTVLRASAADPDKVQSTAVALMQNEWETSASICPIAEREMIIGSRVPTTLISVVPAATYIWVATLPS
jgi:peptide/nickel transport system substrate-binding protein